MKVWDAVSDASITFGEEMSTDDISYIIENDLIINSVNKELRDIKNLEVLYGTKVKLYNLPDGHEKHSNFIQMENGNTYSCDLLVSFYEIVCLPIFIAL